MPSYFPRRNPPIMPPLDQRFRMRVGISHHLVVTTSLLGVEVEYFTRMGQTDGDWKIWLDYDENPDLEGLRHPRLGWDLIGLARLLWAYVGVAETIYQNAKQDGSQVEPFHLEDGIRRWRESHETRTLILSVLRAAERPLTRRQIANLIGLSKHPRLNKLIEEMAEAGEIKRIEEPLRNGKAKFLYSDNKDTPE